MIANNGDHGGICRCPSIYNLLKLTYYNSSPYPIGYPMATNSHGNAAAFMDGIANFGFPAPAMAKPAASIVALARDLLDRRRAQQGPLPPPPPFVPNTPVGDASQEYKAYCHEHLLVPCRHCWKLPCIEPIKHGCDKCASGLHAWCGAAVEMGDGGNRCRECCLDHGVPAKATNPDIIALAHAAPRNNGCHPPLATPTNPPRPTRPPLVTQPTPSPTAQRIDHGPTNGGRDPGSRLKHPPPAPTTSRKKAATTTKKKAPTPAPAVLPPNLGVLGAAGIQLPAGPVATARPVHFEYHRSILDLMEFTLKQKYAKDQQFSPALLMQLRPHHIVKWMHWKAFKREEVDYNNNDHRSLYFHASSLEAAKRAISHYMPMDVPWNDATQTGNPTRHRTVHKVLKRVRELECKGLGAKNRTVCDLTEREFCTVIELLQGAFDYFKSILCVTYMVLKFALIFRCDNVAHLKLADVKSHEEFDFALSLKCTWSKNVTDQRACPDQILMGSMNPVYCVLLHLSIHIESWIEQGKATARFEKAYLFTANPDEKTGPKGSNKRYRDTLAKVYKSAPFRAVSRLFDKEGPLGSHSLRKFASTFARRLGKRTDDVNYRGQWTGEDGVKNKVVNGSYISVEQPFIDADVAAAPCHSSPCSYRPHKDATGVRPVWVVENVTPFTYHFYGGNANERNPALCLGYSLLWAAMQPDMKDKMDPVLRERIQERHSKLQHPLPIGVNPVVRVHLCVMRNNDQLRILEVGKENSTPSTASTPNFGNQSVGDTAFLREFCHQVFTQQQQTHQLIAAQERAYSAQLTRMEGEFREQLSTISRNLCR
jgi:hypothetical protein